MYYSISTANEIRTAINLHEFPTGNPVGSTGSVTMTTGL